MQNIEKVMQVNDRVRMQKLVFRVLQARFAEVSNRIEVPLLLSISPLFLLLLPLTSSVILF